MPVLAQTVRCDFASVYSWAELPGEKDEMRERRVDVYTMAANMY